MIIIQLSGFIIYTGRNVISGRANQVRNRAVNTLGLIGMDGSYSNLGLLLSDQFTISERRFLGL